MDKEETALLITADCNVGAGTWVAAIVEKETEVRLYWDAAVPVVAKVRTVPVVVEVVFNVTMEKEAFKEVLEEVKEKLEGDNLKRMLLAAPVTVGCTTNVVPVDGK